MKPHKTLRNILVHPKDKRNPMQTAKAIYEIPCKNCPKTYIAKRGQWRNSYGLRVGKPAGTRAEGAPAGCPFTLVFQLRLPFQKGAPLQHFFHSLVC